MQEQLSEDTAAESASLAQRLVQRAQKTLASAPGGRFVQEQAQAVESMLLSRLKERMDGLGAGNNYLPPPVPRRQDNGSGSASLHGRVNDLMERSLNQTVDTAREDLFHQVIDQLVADEVRMLTALSDYSAAAVSHLEACTRISGHRERLMSYLSRLGNECGVMLPEQTPYYIHHLVSLGLLRHGGEDKAQTAKYEAIENGSEVREACDQITNELKLHPRFVRQTVCLSDFGKQFWQHCSAQ